MIVPHHLHFEKQQRHERRSHAVRCCGVTYSWRDDGRLNKHEQGDTIVIHCKKCGTVHYKDTSADWSPLA